MTENAIRDTSLLHWDIFVTPSISYVSSYLPPREEQAMWSPISSTLIYGKKDAVLVDTPFTIKHVNELIDWIATSDKNLTTIYITHGHADHWFGIGALLIAFLKPERLLQRICTSYASANFTRVHCKLLGSTVSRPDIGQASNRRGS